MTHYNDIAQKGGSHETPINSYATTEAVDRQQET